MQLQNIECQIAKAQIGRFLAGDALSDETVSQLEGHISKCADCKQNLAERRSVLQAMLSPIEGVSRESSESPKSEVQNPKSSRFDLANFVKGKIQANQTVQAVASVPDTKPSSFWKPALYSMGLGAVLIGMSYASKNLGSVLGSKVAENPAAATSTSTPTPIPTGSRGEPTVSPFESVGKAAASTASELGLQAPEPIDIQKPTKPAPVQKSPKKKLASQAKPLSKPTHHRHASPRPSHNSIRVYNPE